MPRDAPAFPAGTRAAPRWRAALLAWLLAAAPAAAVEKIVVLGLFKDKAVATIDGKRRVLVKGEPTPEGVVLVSSSAEEAVLEVDGVRGTYELGSHIASSFAAPEEKAPVRIWPGARGMYVVDGSINGFPVEFLVDTGASSIAINRAEARRIGIDYLVEGRRGRVSTAGNVVDAYGVVLERVRVGHIELEDVPATVIDTDHDSGVLLGNSFLNRVNLRREGAVLELREK